MCSVPCNPAHALYSVCPSHRTCSPCVPQVQVRYCMDKAPKLVEIIAALPEEHRAVLLPQ